ncbi:MAG: thioredoxin [Planctomycetota bacterium]|jgi:thioredoxin 1
MAGNVIELTDATFDEVVHNSQEPVLVDFWAPWCEPCKLMAPIIEEIADECRGKAQICKINVAEGTDSAVEFGITGVPTIILFKGGQIRKQWRGLKSKKEFITAIDELV